MCCLECFFFILFMLLMLLFLLPGLSGRPPSPPTINERYRKKVISGHFYHLYALGNYLGKLQKTPNPRPFIISLIISYLILIFLWVDIILPPLLISAVFFVYFLRSFRVTESLENRKEAWTKTYRELAYAKFFPPREAMIVEGIEAIEKWQEPKLKPLKFIPIFLVTSIVSTLFLFYLLPLKSMTGEQILAMETIPFLGLAAAVSLAISFTIFFYLRAVERICGPIPNFMREGFSEFDYIEKHDQQEEDLFDEYEEEEECRCRHSYY